MLWRERVADTAARWARRLPVALTLGAFSVFVLLWAGLAYTLLVDASMPDDAWRWLRGLEPAAEVVAWVMILPIAVGLWTWTSSLPSVAVVAIGAGLVLWTMAAGSSLVRLARNR